MTEEKFEEDKFMKILVNLKETQESMGRILRMVHQEQEVGISCKNSAILWT